MADPQTIKARLDSLVSEGSPERLQALFVEELNFNPVSQDILRPGGTLCYVMSDTWQTIKTHKPLRDKLLSEVDCQHIISCPSDTFGATVNVGVYTFRKRLVPKEGGDNWILAADFSPLSIEKGEVEAAFEISTEQDVSTHPHPNPPLEGEGRDFPRPQGESLQTHSPLPQGEDKGEGGVKYLDGRTILSDRDMAIFAYKQKLIPRFSNHSFFIASPKLFGLMKDVGNVKNSIHVNEPPVYTVEFNEKELELLKLGDVAEVKHGMTTGDTRKYIFKKNSDHRGSFDLADPLKILSEADLQELSEDEKRHGVDEKRFHNRYLIPYDKGESSESGDGWLPSYTVKTGYYLDWRRSSVDAMKKLPGHRHDNPAFYFKEGLTYSITGIYAPTFRFNTKSVFDVKISNIYTEWCPYNKLIGLLCSSFSRYLWKNYVCHTVDTSVDVIKELPVMPSQKSAASIALLVDKITSNQKSNPRYDYMTNEQVEIDRLVYQMYNLNDDDVQEVENWFFRRYPRLARVIEGKRALRQAFDTTAQAGTQGER